MSTRPRKNQPKSIPSPEYPLLGLLLEGPSHGYGLHQRLTAELGNVWHLSQSQVYSVLKRLEQRGDVTSRTRPQPKLPARQVLHITAAGRRRFGQWMDGQVGTSARTVRLEFLTRLYFAMLLMPDKVKSVYAAQAREISGGIRRLRQQRALMQEDQTFDRMSIDLRLRQMELTSHWLREIRARFHIASAGGR